MPGARLSRHELKTQDEITSSLQSFTELLETKKKEVLIAVAALIVVAAVFMGWRAYAGQAQCRRICPACIRHCGI